MLERCIDFFMWCVTIAATLIGAAGIMLAATFVLYLAYKAMTWQANRIARRLVNLQGMIKTRELYRKATQERSSDEAEQAGGNQ